MTSLEKLLETIIMKIVMALILTLHMRRRMIYHPMKARITMRRKVAARRISVLSSASPRGGASISPSSSYT